MKFKYAGMVFMFALVLFPPLFVDLFNWIAELLLPFVLHSKPLPNQIYLLAGKIRTLLWLISFFLFIIIFRDTIIGRCRVFLQGNEIVSNSLGFFFLALPGVVFYFVGIRQFLINNYPLIFFGLLSTIVIEFIFLACMFYLALLLPVYQRFFVILLISSYQSIIFAMTALISVTAEMNYSKYIGMIWEADFGYLLNFKIIFSFIVYFLITILITLRLQNQLMEGKNYFKKLSFGVVIATFFLIFKPVILVGDVLALPYGSLPSYTIKTESENVNALVSGRLPQLVSSLLEKKRYSTISKIPKDLENVTCQYNLFQTPHSSIPSKQNESFNRIILLTVESLSLDFTGLKSPCSQSLTPRIDSLMAFYPSGILWTNASPTLQGLSTIFSSHPNAELIVEEGFPNSFVRILQGQGYRTAFIRSAPEDYANEHLHFRKVGFQEIYGRNFFRDKKQWVDHISQWGLEDAYLFDYAIEFIKQNKMDKLFVHLLPADTHPPYGREKYSNEYPDIPNGISCRIDNRPLLRSFYRQDFDIGRFYDALIENNLLDSETLFIITADHSSPRWYKPEPEILEKIPIIFISKKKIFNLELNQPRLSQVDIAPTILEFAGLSPPFGYFGKSLFRKEAHSYFGIHGGELTVRCDDKVEKIPIEANENKEIKKLSYLLNTVFVE